MARTLSPFTRITLLINELNGNRIEDLGDRSKCDLAHHTARLMDDIEEPGQHEQAVGIDAAGHTLLTEISAGRLNEAETRRSHLVSACKRLKDLL